MKRSNKTRKIQIRVKKNSRNQLNSGGPFFLLFLSSWHILHCCLQGGQSRPPTPYKTSLTHLENKMPLENANIKIRHLFSWLIGCKHCFNKLEHRCYTDVQMNRHNRKRQLKKKNECGCGAELYLFLYRWLHSRILKTRSRKCLSRIGVVICTTWTTHLAVSVRHVQVGVSHRRCCGASYEIFHNTDLAYKCKFEKHARFSHVSMCGTGCMTSCM